LLGDSHLLEGVLEGADEARVTVVTPHGAVEIPYKSIKSARTVFEWN
jgi:ribosome maturation factor RimP